MPKYSLPSGRFYRRIAITDPVVFQMLMRIKAGMEYQLGRDISWNKVLYALIMNKVDEQEDAYTFTIKLTLPKKVVLDEER